MYKITKDGKTIVGNNEDFLTPNNQFWFEQAGKNKYGVMYMGLLDNFAQGAINEVGLVFDGFANPELPINNTEGKKKVLIGTAIRSVMQTMSKVEEVKAYLETINLGSLSSAQLIFVDKSGKYLIVEGDELVIGDESEKTFSNFYYSQVKSEEDVELQNFKNGMAFQKSTEGVASLAYCGEAMDNLKNSDAFGTQYSTIYDLQSLTVRIYLFHDYSQFVELDLMEELKKDNYKVMIPELFPENSIGRQHYLNYYSSENPTKFLKEIFVGEKKTENELEEMDFSGIVNMIGYEFMNDREDTKAAIKIFEYGTKRVPNNANLFDSFGEAYFRNGDYEKAKINYGKSLELDSGNDNAREFLAKIDSKKNAGNSFEKLTKIVDQHAENMLKKGNVNSFAVAIYRNGEVYQNYYGEMDKSLNNPPNGETLFEIASISKVFAGSLAARAVVEKKISLDDDVRKYLVGNYSNLEFEGTAITIRNLLTHSLGFKNKTPKKLEKVNKKIRKGNYEKKTIDYGMTDLLEELKSMKLDKKPGTHYEYTSVGPELVAYILEQVYEKPYKELLMSFFDELDMKNSYLQEYEIHKNQLSNSYDEDGKLTSIDKNPLLGGAAGVISTLPDLTKFMQFQLESKDLLIKESTQFLFKNGKNDDDDTGYLWDVGIGKEEGFYYSKTGTSRGVQSGLLVCPDSDYGLVLIMNNNSDAAMNDWVNLYNRIENELIGYPKINLVSLLQSEFMENPEKAFEEYRRLKSDSANYLSDAKHLNNFGYDLLFDNQTKRAIELFKFATSENPENANLFDSLGEAYFLDNNNEKALFNYKKSLALNPNNKNAEEYISKINKLKSKDSQK
jgi:CubicO group peptidase (beta-lactamase class C family)